MKTLDKTGISNEEKISKNYSYQPDLTLILDGLNKDFDQNIINAIVLWKVNRYVNLSEDVLASINKIDKNDTEIDVELTTKILRKLLDTKGIRLAMASTILRFKNPNIYQIIDQRVYRFVYGEELKYSLNDIDKQIKLYLCYLKMLKSKSKEYNFDFKNADRILYEMDKEYNKELKIKY